jgi:histone demethylase JARID1
VHWGETKTWYGVPGDDADKFEEAIKSEAPELFEQQPALLYQLVTMMNPGRLQELGVKVVGCDQRPNEFVVTWPKAYHCGFNHGINLNEAVNFALPDWLSQGKECVLRYKQHAKPPVFSHNELLITITLFSDTIKTALWVQDSLAEMVDQETARRDQLRKQIPLLVESLVEEDCPEEQYQCCICKGFCYLSQMTCSCTKLVACIEHADQLCGCAKSKRTLRKRYSENQLEEILSAVEVRAAQPGNWLARLDALLEAPRPPLKTMRTLLSDGERISYPIPEVDDLRALIDRANTWVEKVAALGQRKSTGRRRKGRQADTEEQDRSPDTLRALLREVEKLAFDSPEISQLRQVLYDIESFKQQAESILSTPDDDLHLEQCRTALILGKSLNIDMPEIAALSTIVDRLLWYKKLDEDVDDHTLSLANVLELLDEARACGVPVEHPTLVELRDRQVKGQAWRDSVQQLFAQPRITVDEITALIEGQDLVPTDIDIMKQLETMKKTAQTWQTSAVALLGGTGTSHVAQRLLKQIKSATGPTGRLYIPEIAHLQTEMDFHAKYTAQLAALLGCQKTQITTELNLHLQLVENGLDPEDDIPKEDWATCFCRGSPTDPMVTCDECAGSYHPKCVGLTVKQIDKPFICEMCSGPYDPSRPSVNALGGFADKHKWNFIIPPLEMETISLMTRSFVRYAKIVLDVTNPKDQVEPCRDIRLITHHLRKLYNIPLLFDAHDYETNTIVVFETWLQRRWREAKDLATAKSRPATVSSSNLNRRTADQKYTRSRKPKFVLKESHENSFSCICSTPPLDHLLVVHCLKCRQGYHASCVRCPTELINDNKWKCPCCTVRAGQHYSRNVELRVQMTGMSFFGGVEVKKLIKQPTWVPINTSITGLRLSTLPKRPSR